MNTNQFYAAICMLVLFLGLLVLVYQKNSDVAKFIGNYEEYSTISKKIFGNRSTVTRTTPTTSTGSQATTQTTTRITKPKTNSTLQLNDLDFKLNNKICNYRNKSSYVEIYATIENKIGDTFCQAVFLTPKFLLLGRKCFDEEVINGSNYLVRPAAERYLGYEYEIEFVSSLAGGLLGLMEIKNDVPVNLTCYASLLNQEPSKDDHNFLLSIDTQNFKAAKWAEYKNNFTAHFQNCMPREDEVKFYSYSRQCYYFNQEDIIPELLRHSEDTLLFGFRYINANSSAYIEGAYFETPFGEHSNVEQIRLFLEIKTYYHKIDKFLQVRRDEIKNGKKFLPENRRHNLDIPEPPPPPPPKKWYEITWNWFKDLFG